jgi:membrane protein
VTKFKEHFDDFWDGLFEHDIFTLSAALSFYTALSLAPLLMLTLTVMGWFGPDLSDGFIHEITRLVGVDAGKAVEAVIENAQNEGGKRQVAGALGTLVLLFSASSVFAQLQASLNHIWQTDAKKPQEGVGPWVRKRLLSFGMVLTLAFLGLVSLAASAILAYFFERFEMVMRLVNVVLTWGIFGGVFAVLFKFLPDTYLPWRGALVGGFITAILFSIGKELIGLYLGHSALGSAYGAAGSMVVLLAWVYYSAIIFFMGAEITRVLSPRGRWHV